MHRAQPPVEIYGGRVCVRAGPPYPRSRGTYSSSPLGVGNACRCVPIAYAAVRDLGPRQLLIGRSRFGAQRQQSAEEPPAACRAVRAVQWVHLVASDPRRQLASAPWARAPRPPPVHVTWPPSCLRKLGGFVATTKGGGVVRPLVRAR